MKNIQIYLTENLKQQSFVISGWLSNLEKMHSKFRCKKQRKSKFEIPKYENESSD